MPSEKYASPEIMLKIILYAYHERGIKIRKTSSGYLREENHYVCSECSGCPHKEKCLAGKKLRMNRSIQAEGGFADIKGDSLAAP